MKYRFHPEARVEYREATSHYGEIHVDLSEDFAARFEHALTSILRFPKARAVSIRSGVRQILLRRFPYKIVYGIEVAPSDRSIIVIYAVAHAKRRPNYWVDRLLPDSEDAGG